MNLTGSIHRWLFRLAHLLLALVLSSPVLTIAADNGQVTSPARGAIWVLQIDGAIGPATSDYVVRGFREAADADASLIILQMNTPGGLDTSMRDIIRSILASDIPIVSFVGPKGARAASAGTYISYASHVAAMAPATNLGAATPVQIATPSLPSPSSGEDEKPEQPSTAMERKMVNDASAYIRGLAKLHGRNTEWAEKAVRDAASLSAEEALELNVIDIIADDIDDLITTLDGRTVTVNGEQSTLSLSNKEIYIAAPDWRTEFLTILTNPNILMILGMLGIYGIILEFYNPGATVPGVVGVICLVLAGYSMQLLPVNYAGVVLILLGVAMMIGEAMLPSFGIVGIGGIVAFSLGGLMLVDSDMEAFQVGLPIIAATAILSAGLIIITISIAMKMRKKRVSTGIETIVGDTGQVLTNKAGLYQVRVGAEIWDATCSEELSEGDSVTVRAVHDLQLEVSPREQQQQVNR